MKNKQNMKTIVLIGLVMMIVLSTTYLVQAKIQTNSVAINSGQRADQSNQTGSYFISSVPTGANIFIDGRPYNQTPRSIVNIPVGNHTVVLQKSGYSDWIKTEYLGPGQTIVYNVTLMPIPVTGSYYISSFPGDASVCIDMIYKGQTPLYITNIPMGNHTVTISKDGYRNWSEMEYLAPGQTIVYNVTLTPIFKLGDVNNDGMVTFADIDPFVAAIGTNESQFQAQHPAWSWRAADCNLDGMVTFADVDPFVALIGT